MKPIRISALCFLLSALALAAQPSGVVTKTATHATLSAVTFPPPARPAPVIAADVISDKATARLTIQFGDGARHAALSNAANNATTLYLSGASLATNTVLLHVAGETVTAMTVASNALPRTNSVLALHNPVGMTIASATAAREVKDTRSNLVLPATAAANRLWLDTTNGWAADDVALMEGPPNYYQTGVVATATSLASYPYDLPDGLPFDVAYAATVREFGTTNHALLADVASDAVILHVAGTNGFVAEGVVVVVTAAGPMYLGSIDSVNTTNVTLVTTIGVALAAGDQVYSTTAQAYTVGFPGFQGERRLSLNTTAGLAVGDRIAVDGARVWDTRITGTNAVAMRPTMTFVTAPHTSLPASSRVWQLTTNIYTTARAAAATDSTVYLATAAGLAAGDYLMLQSGTNYTVDQLSTAPASEIFLRADLSAATGVTVAAGDILYAVSSTFSSLIGAATVRLVPTAWTIPQACPARISLDSTTTGTINAVSVDYGQ